MKPLALTILLLVLTPAVGAVTWDSTATFSGSGGGIIGFSAEGTATEVTITDALVTFTALNYTSTTYPSLSLGATADATLTELSTNYITLNATATANQTIQTQAGTRHTQSVTGAASWSGEALATIVPTVGNSLITVMWGTAAGLSGALIIVPLVLFGLLILGARRKR